MINLPIFRAKKLGTKNVYVEGFLKNCTDTGLDVFWIQDKDFIDYRIDIAALSINFPVMLDSQGSKIFASLHEDGKGGDILIEDGRYEDGFNPIFEPYFRKSSLSIFDLPKTPYGEYHNGVWQVDIRLPSHIINHAPTNRFHYIRTIRGLLRKLERKGLLLDQLF